ncbi:MAG: tycC 2 [Nocardia sp.]|uniref:non-ribosomal peptide synthetase n=1 Tax=Nocardia sp. TaxID=1821 RepID=UPI00261C9791|nr:non-ribosomal peptide synthetase [Nocardia sp.]MCU1641955.1 tycC 2 [Nocardia sp.]
MQSVRRSTRGNRRRARCLLLSQLLRTSVESNPDSVALRFNPTGRPEDQRSLTYRNLDEKSSQLARELIARGVGPGDMVAVGIKRSVESVLSVWAIAKTGAAYVPVDPSYPADRIEHSVTDSGVVLGLTVAAHRNSLGTRIDWLELDNPAVEAAVNAHSAHPISYTDRIQPQPEHPAYTIYTSGSTGKPKGVVITHAGIANVAVLGTRYLVTGQSRVLHLSSPSFDVSITEMLYTFVVGATLVIAPPTVFGGTDLADLLRREQVSHLLITPGALESVDPDGLDDVRVVVCAGDRLGPDLVSRWVTNGRRMFNAYGPTEATVIVTTGEMLPGRTITIGSAIDGVGAYILDARLRPVPAGAIGELYLSGSGLAQGYLNQPAQTAERFLPSPFCAHEGTPGARLYRTGDLVRRSADGDIEYLGRSDFQVKIRGLRIELGEIDNALTAHPDIDFAATVGATLPSGSTALVAYALPRAGTTPDTVELRRFLSESLPAYMVPSALVLIDEIPLTLVGKLDRNSLPAPVFTARAFRAPTTRTEQAVADVFATLLFPSDSDTRIGADDDFFELGGNSLLAAQAAARISKALDVRVSLHLLFEASSVAGLAARVAELTCVQHGTELRPMPRPEQIPLSFAQQRIWFLNRFDSASAVDNMPFAVRLSGALQIGAFRAAVRDLVQRHEVLRTVYPDTDGVGRQLVLPLTDPRAVPTVPMLDATEEQLPALITEAVAAGFDVTTAPPIRLRLMRLGPTEHIVVCVAHHIAGDGVSIRPLIRDLMTAYLARSCNTAPAWTPLPVQYADYTLWQREVLGSEDDGQSMLARQIAYWRDRLAGLPDQLDLPSDRPRPTAVSGRGAGYDFHIDAQLHSALYEIAQQHNSTLFMVIHAALAMVLARQSGTRDIAIGTPIAGRGEASLDDVIGMFVNTLVLRADIDPNLSFTQLMDQVRRSDIAAFDHADVPFERLVEVLNPVRSPARHPLFQVMLSFHNMATGTLELPGLTVSGVDLLVPMAKVDLDLTVVPHENDGVPAGMSVSFIYAADMFDERNIEVLADRLRRVLTAVAQQPQLPIGDIEVLDAEEHRATLLNCNDTARPVVPELLLDAYRRAVVQHRDRVAIAYEGVELTYAEFDARVNQLARLLITRGVGAESLVGLAIRRSLDLVVSMYAIVTAGGAWVPLDPDHPADRIGHILDTARPACVLTTTTDAVEVPSGVDVLYLDTAVLDTFSTAPIEAHELRHRVHPQNPAYVIFTSGSTGRPKGVTVSHTAIHNQITWMLTEYPMGPGDAYFQKTATTFDVSLWGYFMPLRAGAKLVVATHDGHRDTGYLAETIAAQNITVTDFVPSMLTVFAAHTRPDSMPTLRDVFVIGEALPPETVTTVQALGTGLHIHNLYGPTEATVSITSWPAEGTDRASVPIGVPQWNSQAYVLDARLHPVGAGVPGELYLAGDQLARGYLRRPDLTADRFLANPFGPNGSRMYRTGDLVRWRAADTQHPTRLEYIGRTDFQVKFRGQRIELGEIETALLAQPSVSQTAAMVVPTALGDQLVAYAVPGPGTAIDQQTLLAAIADILPAYMIPSTVVALDAFPLSTSGKLDRKALPDPVFSVREYRAPAGKSEIAVARVFADVLGVEQVGADDDFFALGGNSLLATRLAARLGVALETRVAVRELFDTSTVSALAARIVPGSQPDSGRPRLAPTARPQRVPLSLAQQRIWVINQIDPASPAYNMPFGIRLTGELDVDALRQAVLDVLERHEALRTRFPIADARPHQEILTVGQVLPDGLEVVTGSGAVTDRVVEMMGCGFDVTEAAPVRARLFTDPAAGDHMLVLVVHHIIADGASLAPLARDLVTAYVARSGGSAPAWAPLEVQYADFALWQQSVIGHDDDENSMAAQQLAYWREQLRDLSDPKLPADRQRPSTPSLRGDAIEFTVPTQVHRALDALARDHRASLFMVIHAALTVLVARLTGDHDITIGTPVAGRGERALDELVGMFVNTLALRTRVDGGEGFEDLVDRVREVDLSAFAHADVPFERVVEVAAPTRNAGQSPLFGVVLSFQNVEQASLDLPGLTVTALDTGQIAAKFDLQVMVEPHVTADSALGEMTIGLAYATDLFDEPTVAAFGRRLERVLAAVAGDARITVGGIDILDESERARLLGEATPAASPVPVTEPHAATLADLLDAAVQDNPDGTALVFADASETHSAIEYLELDERSSRLARLLIDRGVGPEDRVAVGISRSVESVLAVWAIAKTGAAFVPVDPKYPSDRISYLVTDSRVALGLTVNAVYPSLPDVVDWLAIDEAELAHALDGYATDPITDADRVRPLRAAHPAYVTYTSGSTGEPKGVVVTQAGLAGFCAEQQKRYRATSSSRTLHFASPSFDASMLELLLAVGAAATLVVVSADVYGGEALASVLRREKVTHAFLTPAALASVDQVGLDRLRVVIVGGEACPPDLVQRWATPISGRRTREFYNVYGPTETTIVTNISAALLPGDPVTIGGPIRGIDEYVLDNRLVPVPAGVAGELFIAGAQLARGYSDRPALTASRYVANPFGPAGSRLYRTGDLARWTADEIEHLGRNDFQVKIRGFRIELGEIDAVLTSHNSVDFAVTLAHLLDSEATILAAYVLTAPGTAVDVEALIAFAAERLPAHMVPGSVTVLESIPLTPAGKVDRRALPAPTVRVKEFRAPHGQWETLVAQIYAELLVIENPLGADDDFFDLGGNSLIATQVMARLGAALATHVPVPLLFEASTVAGLAARLPQHASGGRRALSAAVPRPDRIPLSPAQQRMWFLNQVDPVSTAYNIPLAVRLSGALDVDALRAAVADVVARHEILRTIYPRYEDTADGPLQVILPVEQAVPQLEVRAIDAADVVASVSAFMAGTSFDVTTEVPLRGALFEIVDAVTPEFVLALVIHHISGDGTSTAPLTRDLVIAYTARAQAHEPGWEPLPVQYADYALWQHDVLGAESDPQSPVAQQIAYWRKALADLPDQLELPTDRARPPVQSFAGDKVEISVDAETHVRLAAVARAHNATLFMVVHTVLAVLLARLSGASDIAIGTPMAGRGDAQLDAMIGMFVNTLVFRTRVKAGASFTELLARQRESDLTAFANADVPFERLVEVLDPARSPARHPLFQVGLSFQNLARTSLELPGLAVSGVDFDLGISQFDLHWIISDTYREDGSPAGIGGVLTFATALFDKATAGAFVERFVRLLTAVAADPGVPVGDIELLDPAEREQVLNAWNRTTTQASGPLTLPGLLASTVARHPHATALISESTRLSYTELDERVNRLARHLISLGAGPERPVALAFRRSADLVIAMYAVSVAGGVYVPVDPDQPADRTDYILESATPVCVLTNADAEFETTIAPVVQIDELILDDIAAGPVSDTERSAPLRVSNIAYVIFTSGSTGRPKGVALPHGAVVNQLLWKVSEFGLDPADAVLLKTAATFDLSVWEFWSGVACGGRLVIADPDGQKDPTYLNELMARESATTLHVVPSMLDALLADGLPDSLERILAIGETLPSPLAQRVLRSRPRTELFNLYGPTEAAVSITSHRVTERDEHSVSIGSPEWNSQVYVLDSRLRPVPVGVCGELYLAGAQLARGYFGRPELTSDRFVANPFGAPGARMYRTGDLVAWQDDAELEYRGRIDFQVKIRGFRIELGEIDTVLGTHRDIEFAMTLGRQDGLGATRLVAYVVPVPGRMLTPADLLTHAARSLPSHMLPSAVVVLDKLPLTPIGKLDRTALPAPVFPVRAFREPRTAREMAVCAAFAEVLGVERIGLDDNFFEHGGNSLSATRLVNRLGSTLGRKVPVMLMFTAPTPADLIAAVAEADTNGAAFDVLLPLRTTGSAEPLFCIHPVGGIAWSFAGLSAHLDRDRPLYGLQSPALLGNEELPDSLEDWARRYIKEIRTIQPTGPFHLLGWSLGGVIAHAMAVQLQEEGEEVALLAMLDSYNEMPSQAAGSTVLAVPLADLFGGLLGGVAADLSAEDATPERLAQWLATRGEPFASFGADRIAAAVDSAVRSLELSARHQARRFHGDLVYFSAAQDLPGDAGGAITWSDVVDGRIHDLDVDATHWGMTGDRALGHIGGVLTAALAAQG